MKEKIIFLTTASLEEDLAEGKVLDAGQIKAIFERYGEDATTQYIMEDFKVAFDVVGVVKELKLVHEIDESAQLSDYLHGYMDIHSDGSIITLSSLLDQTGNAGENYVKCQKVKVVKP
jgi:hypothetical protein